MLVGCFEDILPRATVSFQDSMCSVSADEELL